MSEKGRESDRASAQDIASALESQGSGGYRKIQLVETATRVSSFGPQTRVSVCLIRTGERERERERERGGEKNREEMKKQRVKNMRPWRVEWEKCKRKPRRGKTVRGVRSGHGT